MAERGAALCRRDEHGVVIDHHIHDLLRGRGATLRGGEVHYARGNRKGVALRPTATATAPAATGNQDGQHDREPDERNRAQMQHRNLLPAPAPLGPAPRVLSGALYHRTLYAHAVTKGR